MCLVLYVWWWSMNTCRLKNPQTANPISLKPHIYYYKITGCCWWNKYQEIILHSRGFFLHKKLKGAETCDSLKKIYDIGVNKYVLLVVIMIMIRRLLKMSTRRRRLLLGAFSNHSYAKAKAKAKASCMDTWHCGN